METDPGCHRAGKTLEVGLPEVQRESGLGQRGSGTILQLMYPSDTLTFLTTYKCSLQVFTKHKKFPKDGICVTRRALRHHRQRSVRIVVDGRPSTSIYVTQNDPNPLRLVWRKDWAMARGCAMR